MTYARKPIGSRSRAESLKDIGMATALPMPHLVSKKIKQHIIVIEKVSLYETIPTSPG